MDVRLAASGGDAERQVREAETVVRELLGGHIYGVEDEDLETVIVRLLTENKRRSRSPNPALEAVLRIG